MRLTISAGACLVLLVTAGCGGETAGDSGGTAAVLPDPAETLDEAAPRGRLPDGIRPLAYRANLTIDPRQDRFGGRVEIDIELDRPAGRIWLHGEGLAVSGAVALPVSGIPVAAEYREVIDPGVSVLLLDAELPAGRATLRIDYDTDFDRNLAGLFRVVEQGDPYALAKSESIQARSYLPGFDEPAFKATFDFELTVPRGFEAIGNTPVESRETLDNGMDRVTFATTRPMPTYLLSLAVGPFDVVERPPMPANEVRDRPVPLRGVARKGRGADMNVILDVSPRMLEIFEIELMRPYPFEKLDVVAAPQWPSGATELSAAITYREERILVGDDPAPGARLSLLGVHAHEIAHMWFGNLVTMPWWDDLWLKEGFATWATPVVLTILEPDGGHELNAARRAIGAMRLDSLASTRAIREPIDDNNDIRNAYDSITYAKSLAVIHMVDQYFGPERFRPALGRYIRTFADSTADSEDFYRVIGEETGAPALTGTFRDFVEQTGVPQLDVRLDCDSTPAVTVTQSRYRPLGSPIGDAAKRWTIPLCLRSNDGRQCTMLTDVETVLELEGESCPDWLMPNAGGSGYFRWHLDAGRWQALVSSFDALDPVEQLTAVDSAFAAFESGRLDGELLLAAIEASAAADEWQVVSAPFRYLRDYPTAFFSDTARIAFAGLMSRIYRPVLQRSATGISANDQLLTSEILAFLALVAREAEARQQLLEQAHAFTGFGRPRRDDALSTDLYEAALIVAVQDSEPGFLAHLVAFRRELDDPSFEADSATALGAVTDPAQLEEIRRLVLDGELGTRETYSLLQTAMEEPALQDEHWRWLQANFAAVLERVPAQWRRRTPSLAEHFCSESRLAELEALFARDGRLAPGHQRSLAQTAETIGLCAALRDRGQALGEAIESL